MINEILFEVEIIAQNAIYEQKCCFIFHYKCGCGIKLLDCEDMEAEIYYNGTTQLVPQYSYPTNMRSV